MITARNYRPRALARCLVRHIVVVGIVLLGLSTPARADVIVVANEEQAAKIVKDQYRNAALAMEPCIQKKDKDCLVNMRKAIVNLASGVIVVGNRTVEFLAAVRNNSFPYQRAYSLLFLNALTHVKRGATCDEFAREAAEATLADGTVRTIAQHLENAEREIGNREYLPEYKMLLDVRAVLTPCVGKI